MNRPFLPNERTRSVAAIRDTLLSAAILEALDHQNALKLAKDDHVREAIQKAGVTFTATTNVGGAFAQPNYVDDMSTIIGGYGAFPAIKRRSVNPNFDNRGSSIFITSALVTPALFKFVPQGGNIPVRQGQFTGVTLTPRKAGAIGVLTRTVVQSSNALPLTRHQFEESIPAAFDSILLSTAADDGTTPAGLRNGISADTSGGANAMIADLTLLASKVATVAGNTDNILFICDPTVATKIRIALPLFPFEVVSTAGLAAGTVIALAANAVAIAAGNEVRFEVSDTVSLHMEDTSPADIGIAGTPNVVSAPVRSAWQTDCVAIKLVFICDFKLRVANSLAYMTSVAW